MTWPSSPTASASRTPVNCLLRVSSGPARPTSIGEPMHRSFRPRLLVLLASATLLAACGSDPAAPPPPPVVDPYRSTLEATPADAIADGTAQITLTATARDAGGAAIAGRVATFAVTGSDQTLSAASATTDAAGLASVTLTSTRAEPKTASVAIDGVPLRQQATATFGPGPAAALALSGVPATATAGVPAAITVTAFDAHGNVATGFRGTLHATSTDPAAALPDDLPFTEADAGRRTFAVAWRTSGAASLTLTEVTASSLTVTGSTSIAPAAPFRLAFAAPPSGAVAGSIIVPPVRISILDVYGNLVTGGTQDVTLRLQDGPSGAILSGGGANPSSGGVSEFVAISVDKAPGAYRLAAASDGLVGAVSDPFSIVPAEPDASASSVSALPSSLSAGGTATLTAIVRDLLGNPIQGVSVTFEATGTGNTLSPPVATDAAGMAFGDLTSTAAGAKTVTASAGPLPLSAHPIVTFAAGPVDGARSTAAAAPASLVADGVASTSVTVTLRDAWDNPVPGRWVSLTSSRGTADLLASWWETTDAAGTVTFAASSERAGATTFTALASSSPTPVSLSTSATFVPGPVSATHSTVLASPTSAAADGSSPATVTVRLVDAKGNPVPLKEVSLASDRGADDAIAPASATTDAAGIATFTATSGKFGTATFSAADTTDSLPLAQVAQVSFTGTVSASLSTVTPSAASVLADGSASSAITVKVLDAFGNPVADVEVALASDRGALDTIAPATATTDAAGQVTFGVTSRTFGVSTLSATATGYGVTLTSTATVTFLSYLVWESAPSDVGAGGSFGPAVAVAARDAEGNTDAAFASDVTLALGASPAGATLRGTLTVGPTAGVATFGDLYLEKAGAGYTLVASTPATGVPSITSAPFTVEAGPPASLSFKVQPSTTGAGIGAPILIGLLDAFGNTSAANGVVIAIALGNNPTGAVLGGTLVATSLQGVATFDGLTVSLPGSGYTLAASDPLGDLTPATSLPFDVAPPSPIGDGTPGSCTEATLDAALAAGGHHHFNCGPAPITITLSATKTIAKDVGLDGVGLVTLSGAGARQLFSVPAVRTVALENLTLTSGATGGNGGAVYNAGTLSLGNCAVLDSVASGDWAYGGVSANGGGIHNSGTLLVRDSTFSGNRTGGSWNRNGTFYDGGAIFSTAGTVVVAASTFVGNSVGSSDPYAGTSADGGAIFQSGGTLRVTGSTFSGNSAACSWANGGSMCNGGAIYAAGDSLLVADSTFANNAAHGQDPYSGTFGAGGAIHLAAGTGTVLRSTFKGNTATVNWANYCTAGAGGAIFVAGGALVAANSTFSANSAGGSWSWYSTAGNGGALFNAGGRIALLNATLADNTAGLSWCNYGTCGLGAAVYGDARVTNSIVKGGGSCSAALVDGGHNLDSSGTCGVGPATDPLLSTAGLASNGGPTQTIALQAGSPAIDAGDGAVCAAAPVLGVDQRGYARPGTGSSACSIGAFEYGGAP